MPLAARIDDGDRRPPAVPPHLRVPGVEPSWAPAHLYRALSESGCGDNTPDSFSRSFVGVLLPAPPHDPGSHGGWIRSAFPRRPAAMDWLARRGLPLCSGFGLAPESHTHRSCPDLSTGNVALRGATRLKRQSSQKILNSPRMASTQLHNSSPQTQSSPFPYDSSSNGKWPNW